MRTVEQAVKALSENRSIIVDARLGNGKTVFQWLLFDRLAQGGFRCLGMRPNEPLRQDEITFLSNEKDLVIFLESYSSTQELIVALGEALPNAKFVIEVRTSTYEVRLFEIEGKVPRPYARVSLNRLDDIDYVDFENLCRANGIAVNIGSLRHSHAELRDLLIMVFESQAIRASIRKDLQSSFSKEEAKRTIIVAFLLQLVQGFIDPEFLRLVTGVDPFSVLRVDMEGSEEFFFLAESGIALRSPVFAEFSMREFVETKDLSDAVHDCVVFCANRKNNPTMRRILSAMMQYSRIKSVFSSSSSSNADIKTLYQRLRWYPNIDDEPLFWLQYAILEMEEDHLNEAKGMFAFAYSKAHDREGYRTYQLDTQYLRLLISILERDGLSTNSEIFDEFVNYVSVVSGMIGDDSHRGYAIKVLDNVPQLLLLGTSALSDGEKAALRFALEQARLKFSTLSPEFSSRTGSALLEERFRAAAASL